MCRIKTFLTKFGNSKFFSTFAFVNLASETSSHTSKQTTKQSNKLQYESNVYDNDANVGRHNDVHRHHVAYP